MGTEVDLNASGHLAQEPDQTVVADSAFIKAAYCEARLDHPHMLEEPATGLVALGGGALQAAADARYTALKASVIIHFNHGGATSILAGVHKAADAAAVAVLTLDPDGTEARLINCVGELKTALANGKHADNATAHFNVDAALNADVVALGGAPVDLAGCVAQLDSLLAAIDAHYARHVLG